MIAKLKGVVDTVDADSAIVDVGGVGYLVSASARTLRELAAGDAVTVLVETIVREDAIALYGFLETAERDWFRILTTVQGVGVAPLGKGAEAPAMPAGSINEDAVSALVNLGYKRVEAFGAVARVTQRLGAGAKLEAMITAALQELAR